MSVAASTVPAELYAKEDGDIVAYPMLSGTTIYKGDIVRIIAAGTATSVTTPAAADMFVGVAMETVVDVGGAMKIKCWTSGVCSFIKDTPIQADVGCLAFNAEAGNQQTVLVAVGATTGGNLIIGAVVAIDPEKPTTNVLVKIQPGLTVAIA